MNCRSDRLERFMDLGDQPNGNHFPSVTDKHEEPTFPFSMAVCKSCWQVQIEEFPSPEFMFGNHPYVTGLNQPVISHFEEMVDDFLAKYPFEENSLIIDVGANDGTLLNVFKARGMRILGVDPGKRTGKLARDNGVTVCRTFWNEQTANSLSDLNLFPDVITATAVFYHLEDIHSFVSGLTKVMHEKTVFVAQCIYLKDVMEKCQFDHFYHEHTMIHAIGPLQTLLQQYGLQILDVDFYPVHGGSFVIYVARSDSPYEIQPSVEQAIEDEKEAGLQHIETFHQFTRRVEENRDSLVTLLRTLKESGKAVYALGAPLKGSTLLNYCDIGPELVSLATEINRYKIGKFTPGTHIPIVFEDALDQDPDYYLVLSWNFIDFFRSKYSEYLSRGGKMIVPHPTVQIIEK